MKILERTKIKEETKAINNKSSKMYLKTKCNISNNSTNKHRNNRYNSHSSNNMISNNHSRWWIRNRIIIINLHNQDNNHKNLQWTPTNNPDNKPP
jgi:predicted oxidoreductase